MFASFIAETTVSVCTLPSHRHARPALSIPQVGKCMRLPADLFQIIQYLAWRCRIQISIAGKEAKTSEETSSHMIDMCPVHPFRLAWLEHDAVLPQFFKYYKSSGGHFVTDKHPSEKNVPVQSGIPKTAYRCITCPYRLLSVFLQPLVFLIQILYMIRMDQNIFLLFSMASPQ